jgi:hypothetical protein
MTSFCDLVDLFQVGKFNKDFQVKPPGELDQVQRALDKLLQMLGYLTTYVDEIIVRHLFPIIFFLWLSFL